MERLTSEQLKQEQEKTLAAPCPSWKSKTLPPVGTAFFIWAAAHKKAGQNLTADHYCIWHKFCASVVPIMEPTLKKGDRVRVAANHRWLPQRYGTIKQVYNRTGNRFLVKFDRDELGMWHGEDGDPILRLGERDLVFVDVDAMG